MLNFFTTIPTEKQQNVLDGFTVGNSLCTAAEVSTLTNQQKKDLFNDFLTKNIKEATNRGLNKIYDAANPRTPPVIDL